jgi:hypothetical protein
MAAMPRRRWRPDDDVELLDRTGGPLVIYSAPGSDSEPAVDDRQLAVLLGGLSERLLECALATGPAGDR